MGPTCDSRPMPNTRPKTPASTIEMAAALSVPHEPGEEVLRPDLGGEERLPQVAARAGSASSHLAEHEVDRPTATTRTPTPARMAWRRRALGPGASNRTEAAHRFTARRRDMLVNSRPEREGEDHEAEGEDRGTPAIDPALVLDDLLISLAASGTPIDGRHGGVLDQGDEGGPERGDGAAEGLREDDLAHALSERQADRPGCLGLPGRHGVDAAAQGLADEGRVVDRQHHDRPADARCRDGGPSRVARLMPRMKVAPRMLNTISSVKRGVAEDVDVRRRPAAAARARARPA